MASATASQRTGSTGREGRDLTWGRCPARKGEYVVTVGIYLGRPTETDRDKGKDTRTRRVQDAVMQSPQRTTR
jgi:hypothetical protein